MREFRLRAAIGHDVARCTNGAVGGWAGTISGKGVQVWIGDQRSEHRRSWSAATSPRPRRTGCWSAASLSSRHGSTPS